MRALILSAAWLALAGSAFAEGAYATLPGRDATSCARACADDGLCMAWTLTAANDCELRATAPTAPPNSVAAFGLSNRVPASLRLAEAPAPSSPIASTAPDAPEIPTILALTLPEDDLSAALLGGPEPSATTLSARLQN